MTEKAGEKDEIEVSMTLFAVRVEPDGKIASWINPDLGGQQLLALSSLLRITDAELSTILHERMYPGEEE